MTTCSDGQLPNEDQLNEITSKVEAGIYYETLSGVALGGPVVFKDNCIKSHVITPRKEGGFKVKLFTWRADGTIGGDSFPNSVGPKSLNPDRPFKSISQWQAARAAGKPKEG